MEAYISTLGQLTYSLICPHNAFVSHFKLGPGFRACHIYIYDYSIYFSFYPPLPPWCEACPMHKLSMGSLCSTDTPKIMQKLKNKKKIERKKEIFVKKGMDSIQLGQNV